MKKFFTRLLGTGAILFACMLTAFGQGSTTSSVQGYVTDEKGDVLIGATVIAEHVPSGTQYGTISDVDGSFNLANMRVGGPYKIMVSYTGFAEQAQENVYLNLGQTSKYNFKMTETAIELGAVEVTAVRSVTGQRTGAETTINEQQINTMPTVARQISDYARLTPQATIRGDNTITIAGQNNRFNSIFIDGAVNNDVFGLAASGTNGGQTGISAISPDAIEQFQVVVAPYDVKLGGFSGGGINAVTRSGSNQFEGSAYWFHRDQTLAGKTPTDDDSVDRKRLDDFSSNTYGFRLGGPIVKNKLFFFVNGEIQRDKTPQPFDFADYQGNATQSDLDAIAAKMKSYGYDPGSYLGRTSTLDGEKILARLDYNLSQKHKMTLRHSYTKGTSTSLTRSSNTAINFANDGILFPSTTNSSAFELNSLFSNSLSGNLILGYTTVKDNRNPVGGDFPGIFIRDGNGGITAGSELFSTANELNQDVFTLTYNVNLYKGRHTFTFGTHNEFLKIYNLFIRRSYGYYEYNNFNDFLNDAKPRRYRRSYSLVDEVAGDGSKAAADFGAKQFGLYAQDEIAITNRFKLSIGVRADVPSYNDDPLAATAFRDSVSAQVTAAGYDLHGAEAGKVPGAQVMWSPRLGFNYDVMGDNSLVLRGGAGLFTSRIPYVWPGGSFTNNGVTLADMDASSSRIPDMPTYFIPDPNKQYTNEDFGLSSGSAQIDLFAKDFKFPQVFRASVAADKKMPDGSTFTLEGIFTKNVNSVIYQNVNLVPPTTTLGGADNRQIYSGNDISGQYTDIIVASNTSKGYGYNATLSWMKPFKNGFTAMAAYTFGQSKAVNDLTSSQNSSNWQFNESVNGRNNLPVSFSDFDLGSRIVGFLSYRLEYANFAATTVSLFYEGQSGQRYSYSYRGQVVGDGVFDNDLIFVPAEQSQINLVDIKDADGNVTLSAAQQWTDLNTFIENDDYLKDRRGDYAERNGARLPFTNILDLKVTQEFFVKTGSRRHTLQVSLDVFNFTNLLNKDWGRRTFVTNDNYLLIGANKNSNGEFEYTFQKPKGDVWNIDDAGLASSRWQAQLGLRYIF
ncbi:MAG: TonB-dependent receptor [Saprospiraceae bacterium]